MVAAMRLHPRLRPMVAAMRLHPRLRPMVMVMRPLLRLTTKIKTKRSPMTEGRIPRLHPMKSLLLRPMREAKIYHHRLLE